MLKEKKQGKNKLRSILSFSKSSKDTNFMGFKSRQNDGYKNFLKNYQDGEDVNLLDDQQFRKKNWVPAAIRKIIEQQNKKKRASDDYNKV